jgi:serine/threonine protein kinase
MGVVYKARQVSIDRVIAIKVLNPQMAADPTWVQRFSNEARACSRLQHPNTIRMFDFGQTSGWPVLHDDGVPRGSGPARPPSTASRWRPTG